MGMQKDENYWENFCPYVGLRQYKEQDRDYFCGRSQEIKRISDRLCASRLSILYGPSGVGKSSVLQAGVVPKLRQRKRNIVIYFDDWQRECAVERLRADCYQQIWSTPAIPPADDDENEYEDEDFLPLPGSLDQLGRTPRGTLFLILDQFEEYLLNSKQNDGFDAELARAINNEGVNVHVLIGIRQEDLSKLDRLRPRIPNLLGNALRLSALSRHGAEEALRRPIEIYNTSCPEKLKVAVGVGKYDPVPEIIKSAHSPEVSNETVENGEIEASFLQLVMTELWGKETNDWKKRGRNGQRQLRLTALAKLGGARGIASGYVQREMNQLTRTQRLVSGLMVREMVFSTGDRISRHVETLVRIALESKLVKVALVLKLGWIALRRKDRGIGTASKEAVIAVLGVLEDRRIVRRITPAVYEVRPALTVPVWNWQRRYFDRQQWIRLGVVALVAMLFGWLAFGYFAPKVRRSQTYSLAFGAAQEFIEHDPGLSIRLATAAIRVTDDRQRRSDSLQVLQHAMDIAHIALPTSVPDTFPRGRLYVCDANPKDCTEEDRQNFSFTSVSFSPGPGQRLLAAPFQNKVRVWDLESGKAFNLGDGNQIAGISDAVFSPDGNLIGAATDNNNARIWERSSDGGSASEWRLKTWTIDGKTRNYLGAHNGQVWGIAFDREGDRVATASQDNTVKIWDLQAGQMIGQPLQAHKAEVVSVVFSPVGMRLATASRDHTAILWDLATSQPTVLTGHTSGVYGVAFSPDGKWLATTASDGLVKIWDVAESMAAREGVLRHSFHPGPDTLWGVAFSPPDAAWLAVGGRNGEAEIWDWQLEKHLFNLRCDAKELTDLAFSPDGKLLAAGTKQGYVQIWSVEANRIFSDAVQITRATFYREPKPGRQLTLGKMAVVSAEKGVWLWDGPEPQTAVATKGNRNKEAFRPLGDPGARFTAVALNPNPDDPRAVAVGDAGGTVQVFGRDGKMIQEAPAGSQVGALAFRASGRYIAIGDWQGGALRIWDLDNPLSKGKNPKTIDPGWLDRIWAVAFSPDGNYVAAGGAALGNVPRSQAEVRIWSFKDPTKPLFSGSFCQSVTALDFSLDSQRLAVGCGDGRAWIWDFEDPNAKHRTPLNNRLFNHTTSISSMSFDVHADFRSDEIATGSADGTAKVWNARNGNLLATYYGHSVGVLAVYLYGHNKLATVGTDKTLQLHDLNPNLGTTLKRALDLGGPLTPEECLKYLNSRSCP